MKTKIEELLLKINITPNLRGFQYIVDAVMMLYEDEKKFRLITKQLYPKIAQKNDVHVSGVERCIRHAITRSVDYDHGEMEKELGISPYQIRMTNSEFLFLVLRKVEKY